ncbi:MAG TPA: hypothetical protein VN577_18210 [Terriglobales bacterium]|nr:hypothetical protein [Terriglobales bacterium]
MDSKQQNRASAEDLGERVGRKIGETVNQLEKEAERLISYIEKEVVPDVRKGSTQALRTAATKLAEFADYLDDQKRKRS